MSNQDPSETPNRTNTSTSSYSFSGIKMKPPNKNLGKVKSQPPIRMKPIMSQLLLDDTDEDDGGNAEIVDNQDLQNYHLSVIDEESLTSKSDYHLHTTQERRREILMMHQENHRTHHTSLSSNNSNNESFDQDKQQKQHQHTYPSFGPPSNLCETAKTPKSSQKSDIDFLIGQMGGMHLATPQNATKQNFVQKSPLDLAVSFKKPESVKKNSKIVKCLEKELSRPEEVVTKITTPLPRRSKSEGVFTTPLERPIANKLTDTAKKSPHKHIYVKGKVYNVLSTIGVGGSSKVFQVMEAESSNIFAVKCVNLQSVDKCVAKGYLNEVKLLLKLHNSPHVIRLLNYEYISEKKILYVVMEKGDTDFSKLLKSITKSRQISVAMIIYFWLEMLHAVKYIHSNGIIHSDLKPSNFILVSGTLKLIDFGIASSIQNDVTSVYKDGPSGTYNYMSPEAIQDPSSGSENPRSKVSFKSDVWSLGCILYNLVYGRTPFQHITNNWQKLNAIMTPPHQILFKDPPTKCPPMLIETLKRCLSFYPKDRPSVNDLISIPYISIPPATSVSVMNESKEEIVVSVLNQIRHVICENDWQQILKIFPNITKDLNQ